MKKCLIALLAVLFIFTAAMLNGQVVTERSTIEKKQLERSAILLDPATVFLPDADTLGLSAKRNSGKNNPLPQFAVAIPVDLNMENSGKWSDTTEGQRTWTLDIISKGAYSMHLRFQELHLTQGAQLRIYNHSGTMVQGPFTSELNSQNQTIATDLMEGDGIRLVYTEPASSTEKSKLHIRNVFHGYLDIFSQNGLYAKYNYPVSITNQDASFADAIAMVIVGDTRLCAGFLINNPSKSTNTPYFMTSFSALDVAGFDHASANYRDGVLQDAEIANAENLQFRFKFAQNQQNPTANGAWITYNFCKVVNVWPELDLALLELDRSPIGAASIRCHGWNASEILSLEGLAANGEVLENHENTVLMGSPSRDFLVANAACPAPTAFHFYDPEPVFMAPYYPWYKASLRWTKSTYATKYTVYKCLAPFAWRELTVITDPNVTTYTNYVLAFDTPYWYWVIATNACGDITGSNIQYLYTDRAQGNIVPIDPRDPGDLIRDPNDPRFDPIQK